MTEPKRETETPLLPDTSTPKAVSAEPTAEPESSATLASAQPLAKLERSSEPKQRKRDMKNLLG